MVYRPSGIGESMNMKNVALSEQNAMMNVTPSEPQNPLDELPVFSCRSMQKLASCIDCINDVRPSDGTVLQSS